MHPDPLYHKDFLLGDLYHKAISLKPHEFARFQFDAINQYCPKFQSHILTVNILSLNKQNILDGEIVSAVVNQPNDVIANYQSYLEEDIFTPQTFLHSGAALFIESVDDMNVWSDSCIYRNHCTVYDQYWVLGISYPFPHKKTTFLAMDYIRVKGEGFALLLEESYVEYVSYPFYLGWLYVHNSGISKEQLHYRLSLLAGITETRFHLLRCMAGHSQKRSKSLAKVLGNSNKTIDNNITKAYQSLIQKFPEFEHIAKQHNPIYQDQRKALTDAYSFLILGKGDLTRQLPSRNLDR